MLDPQIEVAVVAGLASIAVAIIQAWSARKIAQQAAQGLAPKGLKQGARIWFLIILISLNLIAIAAVASWMIIRTPSSQSDVHNFQRLTDQARVLGRPYVLESVTALVHLDDVEGKNGVGTRRAFVRIVYVIRALRDIDEKDGTFTEEYRLNPKKIPEHWYGTNIEDFGNDIGNTYGVRFTAKKGELHTVVTGMNYAYQMPLGDGRVIPDGVTYVVPTEDYYMYLNTDDFIGELSVIVESSRTPLKPVERGAILIESQHPTIRSDEHVQEIDAKPSQVSISGKWRNLTPGQSGGIIYAWQSAPQV